MKSLFSAEFRFMFPSPVAKDTSGNRLKEDIKDPQGTLTKTVSYQYDVLSQLARIVKPDADFIEFTYDARGKRQSFKDFKGNSPSNYSYDPLYRLDEVIQPDALHTLYGYDSQDNLASVLDAKGNTTSFVYDDKGRVYQELSPNSGTTTYQYDPAGNVIAKTDARSITVSYSYDAFNRLTLIDFPTDTDIVYTYDTCTNGKGRLCRVVDQSGTTDYSYSPKGELVQEDRLILGRNYTTGYQFDGNGNLEVLTYPSGRIVNYSYDNADRVTSVLTTAPSGAQQTVASSISSYPFGGVKALTYGNGLVRSVGYNKQYRITSIKTGSVQDLTYAHDPNGNILDIIDHVDPNENESFSYDALNRLESATGPWGNLEWTFDNVGNRLSYAVAGGTTNYGYYMGTNRLESLTGATSATFTYDANGNLAAAGSRQYQYNENNRLVRVTDGIVLGDYSYDALQYRVTKESAGTISIFHYGLWGELIEETHTDGSVIAGYSYLNGEPLAKFDGDTVLHIHTDHLGSPSMMTDASAASVWSIAVQPFGGSTVISGTESLNLRFPGHYYDEEIDIHYNINRYYDPVVGRYTRGDPLGLKGGLNSYLYANNNPVRFIDPKGLIPKPPSGTWCGPSFDPNKKGDWPRNTRTPPWSSPEPCDPNAIQKAIKNVEEVGGEACAGTYEPPRSEGGDTSRKYKGGYDGKEKRYWIIPTGDPCVDFCRCEHEVSHGREYLVNPPRPNEGDKDWENRMECAAYRHQKNCLENCKSSKK